MDFLLESALSRSTKLYWLDLTECPALTLSFLHFTPNLVLIKLSRMFYLEDQKAIKCSTQFDHLYLSFTNISSECFVEIVSNLNLLSLDESGERLSIMQLNNVLNSKCQHLQNFVISLFTLRREMALLRNIIIRKVTKTLEWLLRSEKALLQNVVIRKRIGTKE